ncbi:MAG: S-layer homology domain-containing protein [Capsulimonadaceae bacterium]|nr:S-layer homology domain-containing protein [Capsulimonadaceae bacterium]
MKKMLTMVAGAALLATAVMGGANAQGKANGPFADVPTDHWAYQSVEKLRDAGIVIGYPDGTYGGRRALTRYEFATAIARLLSALPGPVDTSQFVKKSDLGGYKAGSGAPALNLNGYAQTSDLDALRAEVGRRLTANEGAVAALRDLVTQFAPELKKLGVDVAAANARIDALDKRVTALEEEVRRVKITGELNTVARANYSNSDGGKLAPIDKDGVRVAGGTGKSSLWTNPEVYDDFLLNIAGRVSDNTQAVVSIDAGNYIGWLQSSLSPGYKPANTNFNLYQAYVTTPISAGSTGATATLGRFTTQFTPLTLKYVDPDKYAYNPQTDNGGVVTEGAKIDLGVAGARVSAFAGNADQGAYAISANPGPSPDGGRRPGSTGKGGLSVLPTNNMVKNIAGARVTYGNPDSWTVGVTGLLGDTDNFVTNPLTGASVNTFGVYGVDGSIVLPAGLNAFGEFAIDTTGKNSQFGNDNQSDGNEAWNAGLGYTVNALTLKVDYKDIYTYFAAPGSWGTIGSWTNPTNIEGPEVSANYVFSPVLSLNLEGDFYQGQYDVRGISPLAKKDDLTRINGGIKYALATDTSLDLGYEWVQWNLKNKAVDAISATGKPVEQYVTIGVGHDLNKNAAVKLMYQILDYQDKGTGFDQGGDSKGGIVVGQATVKF